MKSAIVLAMHGMPPRDFPGEALAEFAGLHRRAASAPADSAERRRHDELERKLRSWPRTAANDPYYSASQELAAELQAEAGVPVHLGFNEFCAPDMREALDAAARDAALVTVVTPMMTRGGSHAEIEIPQAIEQASRRHAGVQFRYAWPFDARNVARFLGAQVKK